MAGADTIYHLAFLSLRDADFRWLAYLITKDIFKDLESTADRLTAAQRSDALPLVNYLKTPTERVYLPVGSVIKTVGLPSGSIRDAWISSLGPRISIRPDLRATQTTPYLIVLPHLHETSAVLTIGDLSKGEGHRTGRFTHYLDFSSLIEQTFNYRRLKISDPSCNIIPVQWRDYSLDSHHFL